MGSVGGTGGVASTSGSGATSVSGDQRSTGGSAGTGGKANSGIGGSVSIAETGGVSSGGQLQALGGQNGAGGNEAAGGSGAGGATFVPCPGGVGKALKFSGDIDDFVTANLGADLPLQRSSRTIELWAYFGAGKWIGEHSLIEYGAGMDCHVFGIDGEGLGALDPYGNGCGADNTVTLVPAVPEVGWLHLTYAYDGLNNKFQFTVNGIVQPIPSPNAEPDWSTNDSPLLIGASSQFGIEGFDGVIDEVRVWNISRTAADITRDMKVLLKGNEPGLVAYYHFDEGQGTTMKDVTAGHHDASMVSEAKPAWVDSDIPGVFSCAP